MSKNNKQYYIALTGAKKNLGDFLITERSIALLEKIAPNYDYIIRPHWEELDDLELVNNSQGIIILGGPGFQMNMYPGVYKLVKNLNNIKVPIYTLGTGWKGVPGDKTTEKLYDFTSSADQMLERLNNTSVGMSCRDYQTQRALNNNGYENVTMTGCPVWYDLESIGKEFVAPKKIKRIVFTPAQDKMLSEQSIEVLKFLKKKYDDAEIIVSFHRGIGKVDQYTPSSDAENTLKISEEAKKLNLKVVDTSLNTSRIKFYDNCDLHVGYRVHAHIYFLSKRLPSILIHEDGRGNGVSEALNSPGIDGYKASKIYSRFFSIFNKNRYALKIYRKLAFKINNKTVQDLDEIISNIEETQYECYSKISDYIDDHYQVMEKYIKNLTSTNGG